MQDAAAYFDPKKAASLLGISLVHPCDGASVLVIPKLISVALYSCNLVEEHVRPIPYALAQFESDIDSAHEKSPDAKSLADFRTFAQSIAFQAKVTLEPIRVLFRPVVIIEICTSISSTLADFWKDSRLEAVTASRELVRNLFPDLKHHDSETALNAMQWMDLEDRKRQEGIARVYLDHMQTAARAARVAVMEQQDKLRQESIRLRRFLREAEDLCNRDGYLISKDAHEAFSCLLTNLTQQC